jgi:hypothetical protein
VDTNSVRATGKANTAASIPASCWGVIEGGGHEQDDGNTGTGETAEAGPKTRGHDLAPDLCDLETPPRGISLGLRCRLLTGPVVLQASGVFAFWMAFILGFGAGMLVEDHLRNYVECPRATHRPKGRLQ